MSAGSFWCIDPNLRDRRSLKNTKFDVDDSGTYMHLHPLPRETVLPLLLGEHFPHSIAVAGKDVRAISLTLGLFYDNYWSVDNILFQCWASFAENKNIEQDKPWHVLCVYTKPEDVHWNKNVDIRFYSTLEK